MEMTGQPSRYSKTNDVPLPAAIAVGTGLVALYSLLAAPSGASLKIENLIRFYEINQTTLIVVGSSYLFNLICISHFAAVFIGLKRQGAKLSRLTPIQRARSFSGKTFALIAGPSSYAGFTLSQKFINFDDIHLLPFHLSSSQLALFSTGSIVLSCLGLSLVSSRLIKKLQLNLPYSAGLPPIPLLKDGIVLGTVNEEASAAKNRNRSPSWVTVGLKGLTGNLFIAGVIGSGKSQILLQLLRQILSNFDRKPCLLAIDPKRTFVLELRRIIQSLGMSEKLVWVSLEGNVRFNPIWRAKMLKDSSFTTVANTLKLASINFLGSSGDSRFWEQSSFNLLKASLIYCAAKYDYFTFKDLYRALIQARDEGLAAELVDCLNAKNWDEEEKANIEMAISYFKDEFSQMDQKIRTSILATATGFLNEFLEYRVARILSPQQNEINLHSISDAILNGMLICLNIENDALARSVGTLFKLLYQEAILDRVTDPKHELARHAVLVMDEFQDVVTSGGGAGLGDDRFLAKAREAKAITIAATQSVSSLENAIRSEPATRELLQNFRSRIFFNTTDPKTIRLFQEPHGTEERERKSHSYSESSQDARADVLFGGFDSQRSNISESVSTQVTLEHLVTAREFSRLRTFEAFAQIFDGLETRFDKLYLKPYFLKNMRTPHRVIMNQMKESATPVLVRPRLFLLSILSLCSYSAHAGVDILFPNICSVVKTKEFLPCLGLSISGCLCGWPIPRPCAQITYSVPQTFIEVWPNSKDSFFTQHPGALIQLKAHEVISSVPFGVDDDQGTYAFHARAIPVPFAFPTLAALPCGNTRLDKPCFDLMSEDLGTNWRTGSADSLQPQYLAWSISPKACALKGSAEGVAGIEPTPSTGSDYGGCSYPLGMLPKYPPSSRGACNGWGVFFPRSGIYDGGSRSIAALMIASRLKSIGVEISHTIPGGPGETWQMLYPQSSSCFKEGANPAVLELTKGLRETGRFPSKPNGYLFVVWKKTSCCRDIPLVVSTIADIAALSAACIVVPGGGT